MIKIRSISSKMDSWLTIITGKYIKELKIRTYFSIESTFYFSIEG